MRSSRKELCSRSRSGTTGGRSTIRVRNPAAGVVYHLVFEGNLRKLTGDALSRHLAAVSGVPQRDRALFTEEGKRVRPNDDGRTLGLMDGCTLTLQVPEDSSAHSQLHAGEAAARTGSGARLSKANSVDAWQSRRAVSPALAAELSDGEEVSTGPAPGEASGRHRPHDPHRLLPQQPFPLADGGYGAESSPMQNGRTNTYSDGGNGFGMRQDGSYAEEGEGDFDVDTFNATDFPVTNRSSGQQTGGASPSPYQPRGRAGQHPDAVMQMQSRRQQQQAPPPHSLSVGSAAASTLPSPAEERDVREDFSKISSTPAATAHRGHEQRAERPHRHTHRHRHSRHGRRADEGGHTNQRPPHPNTANGTAEPHSGEERPMGKLVLMPPSSTASQVRSPQAYPPSVSTASRPAHGGKRQAEDTPITSVLAGVTPEEQAQMTTEELAELLAEREYVWQMEQQRFHTERAHHSRELQRRERELLYEAQLLTHRHLELARETERQRRRLAELQAARALPGEVDMLASAATTPALTTYHGTDDEGEERGHQLARGYGAGAGGGVHTQGQLLHQLQRDFGDSERSAGRPHAHGGHAGGEEGEGRGYGESEGDGSIRVHAGLGNHRSANKPIHPMQRAAFAAMPPSSSPAGMASSVAREMSHTPASVTKQRRWPGQNVIQVLATSRTDPAAPATQPGDEASGASPLPRPCQPTPPPPSQQHQHQQPMSLFYSTLDDRQYSTSAPRASQPTWGNANEASPRNSSAMLCTDLF